jgi:hypothetical protein
MVDSSAGFAAILSDRRTRRLQVAENITVQDARPGDVLIVQPYGEVNVRSVEGAGCDKAILIEPIAFNGATINQIGRMRHDLVERIGRY